MLSFDVLDKSSPTGESIVVCGAFLNRAVIWAIMLVCDCVVSLKIFNRIERFLDHACINIASEGLDNVHEMGMPSIDMRVKFILPRKSERTTGAARIRTVECVFLRMGFQVTLQVMLSRKPFPLLASRDITPMSLHMKLEMPVEVGHGLEWESGFSGSTTRPLAHTWSDELVPRYIMMAMQVLSKVLFTEERLLFAGWPLATHWCPSYRFRNFAAYYCLTFERPTSVSLKKKTLPEVFPLAETQVASWSMDALLVSRPIETRVSLC
jgi:hypothetical protein